MIKGLQTKIDEGNIGYDMLKRMGYQGQGLGKDGNGMREPLPLVLKTDRKGLGTATAQVQTANAGSKKSQTKRPKSKRKKTAEEKAATRAKVQACLATDQVGKALKAAEKATELAIKAQQVVNQLAIKDVPTKHSSIKTQMTAVPPPSQTKIYPDVKVTPDIKKTDPLLANDTSHPQFLKSLLKRFNTEIMRMQLRLKTDASLDPEDDDYELIVAKIHVGNDKVITEDVFEFIRTELVGWIGVYQEQGLDTPIFHSMNNNTRHISVVCDEAYAYNCLEQCVEDLSKVQCMKHIRVLRMPRVTPSIYSYEAIYEGITRDPSLLLHQVKLHKPKLLTEYWEAVSHEVCTQKRRTYFIFLVDERSALSLNYEYSSIFCICMQTISFRYCGLVTENYLH